MPTLRSLGGVICLALGVPAGTLDAARAASVQLLLAWRYGWRRRT